MPKGRKESAFEDRLTLGDQRKVWGRHEKVEVRITKGHRADLQLIATAWNCSVPNVMFVVLSVWIDDSLRDRDSLGLPFLPDTRRILKRAYASNAEAEKELYE